MRQKHTRRGLGELIGSIIVITIIVSSSILITYSINRSGKTITKRMQSLTNEFLEQTDRPLILPYIKGKTLKLFVTPLDLGENISLYIINNSKIIIKHFKTNKTYINTTIFKNYNCENIKIIIVRESGAIFIYNALDDPRANTSKVKEKGDPHIFSCDIINNNKNKDILTKITLTPLTPPKSTQYSILNIKKTYRFNITGNAYINNNTSRCDLTIKYKDNSIHFHDSCEARINLDNETNYNLILIINKTTTSIYIYLVINTDGEGNVIVGSGKVNTYLNYFSGGGNPPTIAKVGTINNTVLPLLHTSLSFYKLHSLARIVRSSNTYIYLAATANGTFYTNKLVLLTIITNKIKYATIKVYAQINIDKILKYYGEIKEINLGKIKQLEITGKPYWKTKTIGSIGEVLNNIPPLDWGVNYPKIIINQGRITRKYEITPRTRILYYNDKNVTAHLVLNGGFNLPLITGLDLTQRTYSESNTIYREINGTTIIAPVALSTFVPMLIKINNKYYLYTLDTPSTINIHKLGLNSTAKPDIIYILGGQIISSYTLNASTICYYKVTGLQEFQTIVINPVYQCGEVIRASPQTIGIIVIIKESKNNKNIPIIGVVYRIMWSS